jgi:O-antigen ligase
VLSFIPFVIVALISTLLASLQGLESLQGITPAARTFRVLVTLGVGSSIYLLVTLWPENENDLKFSLRWLYAGFSLALLWGTLQMVYVINFIPRWFDLLSRAQQYISIRKLFVNRVSGLTYEPNWFADQISFLLLPWLLAAVLSGFTVFRWRWRWLTIELFLLVWALVILPFTFSRAGLLVMIFLVVVGVLFFRSSKEKLQVERPGRKFPWRRIFEVAILLAVLVVLIFFAGSRNDLFARIWQYWERAPREGYIPYFVNYLEFLGFGARFTYMETAYRIFDQNPVLGVGLGNYAFYFNENLPDRPLATVPEVLRLVVPESVGARLITPKNLVIRILAETGILGLSTFIAFIMAVLGSALYMWFSPLKEVKFWGNAGLLGLIAFGLVAFSFDSFAIPNMWVVFGLITAAMRLTRKKISSNKKTSESLNSSMVNV